jgi:ribosomal protein S27AE
MATIVAPNRICPECGQRFKAHHGRQRFCETAHKTAFHARNRDRGKVAIPLVQIWRLGKNGKTAERSYAFSQLCALTDLWNEEDRNAGRRPDLVVKAKMRAGWIAADAPGGGMAY